ncbi:MAG TPA: right-handed parallel beta-helix repeat-containing protein, partial [Gemmataceae bacterium]|nr:right-handed parallel beta-helix repeat-containing protein [Gemmataceae bacterium]
MALLLRTRWLSPLSLFVRRRRHPVPRAHRLRYRPRLDLLEPRLAPATFTVNDPGTDDLANPQDHTAQTRNQTITLISALEQNEYDSGGDVIQFIGPMTIRVTDFTGLGDPAVPITIVGLKQGNDPGVTIDHTSGGDQELIIGGGSSVSDLNLMNMGLWAYGDGCTIEDVYSIGGREGFSFESNTTLDHCVVSGKTFGVINPHEKDPAVRIGSGCTVQNCFIGTTPDGTGLLGNANADGLEVWGSNNTITHNVIAGSQFDGLDLYGDNNQVQGNRIGTDVTGTVALGNGWAGISVSGSHNLIGGSGGKGNIISGNTFPVRAVSWGDGVDINRGVGNIIQGNYIGTDASGTQPLGNSDDGIVDYGSGTIIGGLGAGNVISGNGGNGIALIDATGTIIQGNYIGTDINGTNPLGNGGVGVSISAGPNNVIGAPIAGAGNLIDCNGRAGIFLGIGSNSVIVQGNYIGTNPAGADLANQGSSITINGSS